MGRARLPNARAWRKATGPRRPSSGPAAGGYRIASTRPRRPGSRPGRLGKGYLLRRPWLPHLRIASRFPCVSGWGSRRSLLRPRLPPLCSPVRSNLLARDAQTGPRSASGKCLPGGAGRDPGTMLPGGRGPRRVAPIRGAGRTFAMSQDSASARGRWPQVTTALGGSATVATWCRYRPPPRRAGAG